MPKNARFWRNVTLIGFAHTAVIAGLIHWTRDSKKAPAQSILWMGSGSGGSVVAKITAPSPVSVKPPLREPDLETESRKESASEEDRPVLTSAKSEIELPASKPSVTRAPTRNPSATPKVKVTPHPTPKPKPRPTATPKPKLSPKKLVVAKLAPNPSPLQTQNTEEDTTRKEQTLKEPTATALENTAVQAGGEKGAPVGAGAGRAGGGSDASQFGWYGSMLHDRFYSEWVQPTNVATTSAKNSVLAKLRIEKDGRVSRFEIIRPSGNTAVDESVAATGKRVTQVDPLPSGLGDGEHYDVRINFELSSE
jgi:TonB family protein